MRFFTLAQPTVEFLLANADRRAVVVSNDRGVRDVAEALRCDFVFDLLDHRVRDPDRGVGVIAAGVDVLERTGARPGFVLPPEALHNEHAEHGIGHGEQRSAECCPVRIAVEPVDLEYEVCRRPIVGDAPDSHSCSKKRWVRAHGGGEEAWRAKNAFDEEGCSASIHVI